MNLRAVAPGGVERRVDGVRHASVDLSLLFYGYLPYGTIIVRRPHTGVVSDGF